MNENVESLLAEVERQTNEINNHRQRVAELGKERRHENYGNPSQEPPLDNKNPLQLKSHATRTRKIQNRMPLQYLPKSQSRSHAPKPPHRQQHRLLHQRRSPKPPTTTQTEITSHSHGVPERSMELLRLQIHPPATRTLRNTIPLLQRPHQLVLPTQRRPPNRQKTLQHLPSPTRMPHLRNRQPNQPRPMGRNDRT